MLTKVCSSCKVEKWVDEFDAQKQGKHGVRAKCKPCIKEYMREYYSSNKKAISERNSRATQAMRTRNKKFVVEYLRDHPCIDCGESRLPTLQFDHRDPEDKVANVSHLTHRSYSLDSLREEIDKCDVRCANCHAMRTADQFNWFRLGRQENAECSNTK